MITAGVLLLYYIFMQHGHSIELTRAAVFNTIILSNIFLTFSSRSFTATVVETFRYKNSLAPFVFLFSAVFLILLNFSSFIMELFQVQQLTARQFGHCLIVAVVSVFWFEVYKLVKRKK